MKKAIDLTKKEMCSGKAESTNICSYLCRDYEEITTWNQLIPITQEIGDEFLGLHSGEEYYEADLLYEQDMICVLHKDVSYVRNKVSRLVDYIKEQKATVVHGCLYRLTVENLYRYEELRDALADEQIHHISNDAYVWIVDPGAGGRVFSFVDAKDGYGFAADFCNEDVLAINEKEMITELYKKSGQNVEPKIVFQA
tara:strand:+ start:575 stop:1165 length:591 start_codon:yes stop_codon:yes gene_type:complete